MTLRATKKLKDEYRNLLYQFRTSEKREPIANRHPYHGQIAVSQLLELGIEKQRKLKSGSPPTEVLIVTGSAPDHVYCPEDSGSFPRFLEAGGRIRMIIWTETFRCGERFQSLADKFKSQVECRLSQTDEYAGEITHFLLVGSQAYRVESPHEPFYDIAFDDFTPEINATICFNDGDGGASLRQYFEQLWELVSEEVIETAGAHS